MSVAFFHWIHREYARLHQGSLASFRSLTCIVEVPEEGCGGEGRVPNELAAVGLMGGDHLQQDSSVLDDESAGRPEHVHEGTVAVGQ